MSGVIARRRARRLTAAELAAVILPAALAAPAIIVPRRLLYYRGRWNGPGDFAGQVLIEGGPTPAHGSISRRCWMAAGMASRRRRCSG